MNEVEVEEQSEERGSDLRYRYLPPDEWGRALPLLSYASAGQPVTLDPDSQSVVAVETPDGHVVSAAIVTGAFHVTYLIPIAKEVNILTMQSEVERLLPPNSVYYVITQDEESSAVMRDTLNMVQCDGTIYAAKVKS